MAVVRAGDAQPDWQTHDDSIALSQPVGRPEGETLLPGPVEQATADSSGDLFANGVNSATRDLQRREKEASTGGNGTATSKRRKSGFIVAALASTVLVGVVVTALVRRSHDAANPTLQLRARAETEPQQPAPREPNDVPPVAQQPKGLATGPTTAVESAAIKPAASAVIETTRVTLDLSPIDAKVTLRGRAVSGPPFVFELAKDQRLSVEVTRSGFVTAKVVVDDKQPFIHFGMLRERKPRHH
jgi:hypothetical protein